MAQSAQDDAAQRNLDILRQYEQQRRQEEFQSTIGRERDAVKNEIEQEPSVLPQEGPCIDVNTLEFEGVTLLTPQEIEPVRAEYEGRCLYLADINTLAEDITNLYMEKGYITSRAYIPAQDLSKGNLTLVIVEGTLEKIEYFKGEREGFITEPRFAFPMREGDFLNLRDIEQGLDQMNRLKSNNAKMDLLPGTQNGGSVIRIDNEAGKLWHAETGIENTGSDSTGEWQGFGTFGYDNLLGINDLTSLTFRHDLEQANRRQSRNVSFRYEIPYGYWNFSYALSYFNYISELKTTVDDFKTEGFSRSHDLLAARVLRRDQKSKTNFSLGITAKEAENFFAGSKLETSSQKLSVIHTGFSHSHSIPSGFLYGAINFSRGLSIWGAHEDSGGAADVPNGQFSRVTADIAAMKIINMGLEKYNPMIDSRMRALWSSETLFGSEQISVGGPFSVRGFKETSISGEVGAYMQTDISMPFFFSNPQITKTFGNLRPYAGFDIGAIKGDSKNPTEGGTLKSWSLGLKNEEGRFDFDATYSRPVSSPAHVREESHDFYFRASIKF